MKARLLLAGIRWELNLQRPVTIEPELEPFAGDEAPADVAITVSWDWDSIPKPSGRALGDDLLQVYYKDGPLWYCMTKGGKEGPVAGCVYSDDRREITCAINQSAYDLPNLTLAGILRFLPMRSIFQHLGVLFLHGSQVKANGAGIIFAAPSGTGKTTQAKLWQRYRGAEIICNDRTLTRKVDGVWRTYGYPLDGSEPVRSSAVNTLGALVLLEQGPVNEVRALPASKALPRLMPQVVMDCWSGEARSRAMELLLELLRDIPVYLLTCTPDQRAVEALEKKLTEDEVIPRGEDFRPPVE